MCYHLDLLNLVTDSPRPLQQGRRKKRELDALDQVSGNQRLNLRAMDPALCQHTFWLLHLPSNSVD